MKEKIDNILSDIIMYGIVFAGITIVSIPFIAVIIGFFDYT